MDDQSRADFWPTASIENLHYRSRLLQKVRAFFIAREFIEVETPLISRDTVVDCYIDPIRVELKSAGNQRSGFWLQTSPEFAMKRLIAAGLKSIFQFTRAFRNNERGDYHNPEFTIVEWYQVGQNYVDGRSFLGELVSHCLDLGAANQVSYGDAFSQYVGVDPHLCTLQDLERAAERNNVAVPDSMNRDDRDEWLNVLLAECVEPNLGVAQPTVLFDYPASQSALARIDASGDAPVAQRFEAYVSGVELANGYHELCDATELRRRNNLNNEKRIADGRSPLPTESYLLTAMEHGLPACTGVALGFDRLVMLGAGAKRIADVISFGIDRA